MVNHLKQMVVDYSKKGFVLLAIGIYNNDNMQKQQACLDQLDFHGGMHVFDATGSVAQQYGVRGIPHLVLIGRDGITVNGHVQIAQAKQYIAENCTKEEPEGPAIEAPKTDAEVKRRMGDKGPAMNFESTKLKDVLKFITDSTGVPVVLDETSTAAGDEPVSVSMADATLEAQLKMLAASQGLEFSVKDRKIVLSKPAAPTVKEPQFAKGTAEYDAFMELLKQVVSRSHVALKADSVSESIEKLSSRDRDKMERMVRYKLDHASATEAGVLRTLRDLLKE
ncbi:MAG: hypothetical protein AB7K09_25160 [Planctomycetota bacterium]